MKRRASTRPATCSNVARHDAEHIADVTFDVYPSLQSLQQLADRPLEPLLTGVDLHSITKGIKMNFDKLKPLVAHMTHHNLSTAQGLIDAAVELLQAKPAGVKIELQKKGGKKK